MGDLIAASVERLYPAHPAVTRRTWLEQLRRGAFTELAASMAGHEDADFEERNYYEALAELISDRGVPDYPALRAAMDDRFPMHRAMSAAILGRDALRRSLPLHAMKAVSPLDVESRAGVGVLLDAIEMLVFTGKDDERHVNADSLEGGVAEAVRYLGANPQDGMIRVRLASLLGYEAAGLAGLAAAASAALASRRPTKPTLYRPQVEQDPLTDNGTEGETVLKLLKWFDGQKEVVLGRATLPVDLIEGDPDQVAEAVVSLMDRAVLRMAGAEDVALVKALMLVGTGVNAHTRLRSYDLELWRRAGPAFANAGQVQTARDLAEHVLRAAGPSPQRKRAAWAIFADIHHRAGSKLESLLALAAAGAGAAEVTSEQLWIETSGLVRISRDLGLWSAARRFQAESADALRRMGLSEINAHRQRFTAFTIDLGEAMRADPPSGERVAELLQTVAACARDALERNDNPQPVTVTMAQTISWAEWAGVSVPSGVRESFDALRSQLNGGVADLVDGLVASHFNPQALLRVYRGFERARFAEDAGSDGRLTAKAAARMLSRLPDDADAAEATFALELLADRAVARPGWETTPAPVPMIACVKEPAQTAAALASAGTTVAVIGVDASRNLVRVTWRKAGGRVDRGGDEFSVPGYLEWVGEFPYRYGSDLGATANLFYTTTDTLRFDDMPDGAVVVVADTELQLLPPNLIRRGEDFLGAVQPMAAAPSLSWLKAAIERPTKGNGRTRAWISVDKTSGHTFASMAEWLRDPLDEYGSSLDTASDIPPDLAGSEMVIVAAHGELGEGYRFFQRVQDEGSLSVSGRELADALMHVGVVVLFVCSGGRADKSPDGVANVGMAKALLDRGSSAVLASPWPVDPRISIHWLPAFLRSWEGGATVSEANFFANGAVRNAFGFVPDMCLAMSVYGNPILRRSDLRSGFG